MVADRGFCEQCRHGLLLCVSDLFRFFRCELTQEPRVQIPGQLCMPDFITRNP
jgi:hypothetical protein